MTRRHLTGFLVLCSLAMAGCGGEEEARQYAGQLAAILQAYQKKVDQQITDQTLAYRQLAMKLDKAEREDAIGQLDSERMERVLTLKDRLTGPVENDRLLIDASHLREMLYAFGQIEFDENRELVTAELDAYKRFLAGANQLRQDSAGIAQLKKQLEDLSKSKGWLQSIKDAAAFGQKVKEEYDRLLCAESKSEEKDLQSKIAAIGEKLKAPGADSASLKTEKEKLEAILKEVQTRKKGLDSCK